MEQREKIKQEAPLHWTKSDEMLFSSDRKYQRALPASFPVDINFYLVNTSFPVIPNYHDFFEISYVRHGRATYHLGEHNFTVKPGSIVLVQAGQMHNMETKADEQLKSASIYFTPELVYHPGVNPYERNYLLPFFFQETHVLPVFDQAELDYSVWETILQMHMLLIRPDDYYQLELKNRLCELLVVFLKNLKQAEKPSNTSTYPIQKVQRLEKVFEFIHSEFAGPITLEECAEKASMSPAYFCRFFKNVTGLAPIHYLLRYRIEKAKELLVETDTPITDIAFQTGFNNQSYFNRVFYQFTQLQPRQFRKKFSM